MFNTSPRWLPSPPASSPPLCDKDPAPVTPPGVSPANTTGTPEALSESDSLDFLSLIASFLRSGYSRGVNGTDPLILSPIDLVVFTRELRKPRILSRKEVDKLRYDYYPESSTLIIPCMPGAVHNAVAHCSDELMVEMCSRASSPAPSAVGSSSTSAPGEQDGRDSDYGDDSDKENSGGDGEDVPRGSKRGRLAEPGEEGEVEGKVEGETTGRME